MDELLTRLQSIGAQTDNALDRFMHNKELYLKFVKKFPCEKTYDELEQAVQARDVDCAQIAVHTLKGLVGNLGFLPILDCTMDMLSAFRNGKENDAFEYFEDLKEQYLLFCKTIEEYR